MEIKTNPQHIIGKLTYAAVLILLALSMGGI